VWHKDKQILLTVQELGCIFQIFFDTISIQTPYKIWYVFLCGFLDGNCIEEDLKKKNPVLEPQIKTPKFCKL